MYVIGAHISAATDQDTRFPVNRWQANFHVMSKGQWQFYKPYLYQFSRHISEVGKRDTESDRHTDRQRKENGNRNEKNNQEESE